MQIKTIHIKNLRCIKDVYLTANPLTALMGSNNSGKSTILRAIQLFFESAPKLDRNDFTSGCEDCTIEITVGFGNLTKDEVSEFGSAVVNGALVVTRHFSLTEPDSGQYTVTAAVYPGFTDIRGESNGTKKRSLYNLLRKEYPDLPVITNYTEVPAALEAWECTHLDRLETCQIRGFFGAQNVANGKLRKKTGVHLVPAVRDAGADSNDPKRSAIISLLSEISRQTFENRQEVAEFLLRTQEEFNRLSDPAKVPELAQISEILTDSVQKFYSDAKLNACWDQGEGIGVSYPTAHLVVDNKGIITDLSRVGHGLQRAALFSIVQFLAERRSSNEGDEEFKEAASDIILLIEEPEIYQHPCKQIVIFEALKSIAAGHNRGTGIRVQVIYTTHSEKFMRMSDFNIARLVRYTRSNDDTFNSVSNLTISECSKAFAELCTPPRNPMSDEAFVAKLHIFTREVCEGFFAMKVILVEGVTDKAILEAAYRSRDRDIHKESISVISVEGKTKMDKPGYIFEKLGIPTYLVFDNDANKAPKKQNPETNVRLQQICGINDPEDWPNKCETRFCAIDTNLEDYLRNCLEDKYDVLMNAIALEYGLKHDEIKKTPSATSSVFVQGRAQGVTFPLFDEIIRRVDAL